MNDKEWNQDVYCDVPEPEEERGERHKGGKRNRGQLRRMNRLKAKRKVKIKKWYGHIPKTERVCYNRYRTGSVFCSCPMCAKKTGGKRHIYKSGTYDKDTKTNWSRADRKKVDRMKYQLVEKDEPVRSTNIGPGPLPAQPPFWGEVET